MDTKISLKRLGLWDQTICSLKETHFKYKDIDSLIVFLILRIFKFKLKF